MAEDPRGRSGRRVCARTGRRALGPLLFAAALAPSAGPLRADPATADAPVHTATTSDSTERSVSPTRCDPDRVELRGNVALPTAVYRTVLWALRGRLDAHGATSTITAARTSSVAARECLEVLAAEAEEQVSAFLLASGYALARVDARVADGRVVVDVDEGRLDKIIFAGQGAFRQFELRVMLDLPGRVFNRPLVEARLAEIKAAYGVERAWYVLEHVVPLEPGERAFELDRPSIVRAFALEATEKPYELRVYLDGNSRSRGLDLSLELGPPDGVVIGATYGLRSTLATQDSIEAGALFGFRPTDTLDVRRTRTSISRGRLFGEWLSPELAPHLRLGFGLDADLRGRVRTDLGLDSYYDLALRASLFAALELPTLTLRATVGAELGWLPDQEGIPGVPISSVVTRAEAARFRPYVLLGGRWWLNPGEVRRDRAHDVRFGLLGIARAFEGKSFFGGSVKYRYAHMFGWDEVRVRLEGRGLFGSPAFFDQFPLYEASIRGGYGDVFAYRAASASGEYRIALTRDLIKLGVFVETGLAHGVYPTTNAAYAIAAGGASLHILIIDTFQLDLYGGVGGSTLEDRPLNVGVSLLINQAY